MTDSKSLRERVKDAMKLADDGELYLGKAVLHKQSGKVMITTAHPDEEHNCDQMGCASVGDHIIQWVTSVPLALADKETALKEIEERHKKEMQEFAMANLSEIAHLKSQLTAFLSEHPASVVAGEGKEDMRPEP